MNQSIKSCCSRSRPDRRRAAALSALLACALLLSGCESRGTEKTETVRVGVAIYQQDDTFISNVVQEMERLAREKEGESPLKINLSIADGQSNQTLQMEQVDRFLDWGCDVLCVNMVDRTAAAVIVDKAEEAGVPVIFFNRQPVEEDLQRWERAYYVGPRGEQSGIFQGQIVWEQWQEDRERVDRNGDGVLQYVMLEGEPSHQDALLRTEYSIKTLTNAGILVEKLASDTANWNRGQAAAKMSQWYQEFGGQIEAVFANNDDMALGAIDVLLEAGMALEEMPVIVGVDATAPALEAMEAGTLSGTVQNAKEMPQVLMDLALSLYAGEDPAQAADLTAEHYVWLPYRKVNQENFGGNGPGGDACDRGCGRHRSSTGGYGGRDAQWDGAERQGDAPGPDGPGSVSVRRGGPGPGCRPDSRALCLASLPKGQPGKFPELSGGIALWGLAPPPVLCYFIFSKNKGRGSPWLRCGSWRNGRATPPPPSPGSCRAIRRCR